MTDPYSRVDNSSATGTAQASEAAKAKRESLIFGILGLFILGIVFGPLALARAKKAENLGERATAGKVLGWIDLFFGIIGIVGLVMNLS